MKEPLKPALETRSNPETASLGTEWEVLRAADIRQMPDLRSWFDPA